MVLNDDLRANYEKHVSAIKKLMESLESEREELDEEIGVLKLAKEIITKSKMEEHPPQSPKRERRRTCYALLGMRQKAKTTHSFSFTLTFSKDFIKEKNLSEHQFIEWTIADEERRIYFGFHKDDPVGVWLKLAKDRKRITVTPRKEYRWLKEFLEKYKDRRFVGNRQFAIESNKQDSTDKFPYYISIEQTAAKG